MPRGKSSGVSIFGIESIFSLKTKQCNHSIHSTFIWETSLSSLPVIPYSCLSWADWDEYCTDENIQKVAEGWQWYDIKLFPCFPTLITHFFHLKGSQGGSSSAKSSGTSKAKQSSAATTSKSSSKSLVMLRQC